MDHELLNDFIIEAKANIDQMEELLLKAECLTDNSENIDALFRAAHSIKGTAGFFGLSKITTLAHIMESVLDELREENLTINNSIVDTLIHGVDVMRKLINDHDADIDNIVDDLKQILTTKNDNDSNKISLDEMQSAALLWEQLLQSENEPVNKVGLPSKPKEIKIHNDKILTDDSIRVKVSSLNSLLTLTGEIVLMRNQLLRLTKDPEKNKQELALLSKNIDVVITNLHKEVMKTRMQPIGTIFNKFPRMVREIAKNLGKKVQIELKGLDVKIDRSMIEALIDPLTHLARNSIDHGIEFPSERSDKGKDSQGKIILQAKYENGRVIIDISDDGAGLDLEKVQERALNKKIIKESDIDVIKESDIANLIFMPGFSTAKEVTSLSGRGMGLDVVKTNIEKVGGRVEVFSDKDIGTTFRLNLPLTLVIINAFIIIVCEKFFAIPQNDIREVVLVGNGENKNRSIKMVQDKPSLLLRGELIPLIGLGAFLHMEDENKFKEKLIKAINEKLLLRILIIKSGNRAYGIIVDEIHDSEEIMLKPLSKAIGNCGLYSGMTVLGDGKIAMIIDTEGLRNQANISFKEVAVKKIAELAEETANTEERMLLLFKASGNEILGVDMSLISRVQKIHIDSLIKVGSKYYFKYNSENIRVIRPEHYIPISNNKNKAKNAYVIIPKDLSYRTAIIVEEILDTVCTDISIQPNCGKWIAICGSQFIKDKLITLIDFTELLQLVTPKYNKLCSKEVLIMKDNNKDKIKILVVEDTQVFAKTLKNILEKEGYQVILAKNGIEGINLLKNNLFNLIISDIEMPEMDGLTFIKNVRNIDEAKNIPAIAFGQYLVAQTFYLKCLVVLPSLSVFMIELTCQTLILICHTILITVYIRYSTFVIIIEFIF